MGKRGPKPQGEFVDKSAVLSTRISAELRASLESSVKKTGLTLSREIEHRLRRSFQDDEKISEGFGSRRNRALMKMVAMLMQTVYRPDNLSADWLDDPWLFQQVVIRLNALLESMKPNGAINPPSIYGDLDSAEFHEAASKQKAWALLDSVQRADGTLPLGKGKASHIANVLRSDLGEAVTRNQVFYGNAEMMRARATEMDQKADRSRNRTTTRKQRKERK